jgi:hypothetical protein
MARGYELILGHLEPHHGADALGGWPQHSGSMIDMSSEEREESVNRPCLSLATPQ